MEQVMLAKEKGLHRRFSFGLRGGSSHSVNKRSVSDSPNRWSNCAETLRECMDVSLLDALSASLRDHLASQLSEVHDTLHKRVVTSVQEIVQDSLAGAEKKERALQKQVLSSLQRLEASVVKASDKSHAKRGECKKKEPSAQQTSHGERRKAEGRRLSPASVDSTRQGPANHRTAAGGNDSLADSDSRPLPLSAPRAAVGDVNVAISTHLGRSAGSQQPTPGHGLPGSEPTTCPAHKSAWFAADCNGTCEVPANNGPSDLVKKPAGTPVLQNHEDADLSRNPRKLLTPQSDLPLAGSTTTAQTTNTSPAPKKKVLTFKEQEELRKKKASCKKSHSDTGSESTDDEALASPTMSRFGCLRVGRSKALEKLVTNPSFDYCFAILIMLNAVYLGLQVELKAHEAGHQPGDLPTGEGPFHDAFHIIQYGFVFVFTVELVLRFGGLGCSMFCNQDVGDAGWNVLDLFIVSLSVLDVIVELLVSSSGDLANVSVIRLIRFVRIVRILRIIRVMRFFRSLRILIMSIFSTLRSLFWAMVLLVIIMYLFGVLFSQAVVDFIGEAPDLDPEEDAKLRAYFGTVPRAVGTLFMTISGGINWEVVTVPLSTISSFYVLLFVFYIVFASFAVMNVVTGVFCQGAIESAQFDQEEVIIEQMLEKDKYTKQLNDLFHDIGGSQKGIVTLSDFERFLEDARVKAYFEALELQVHEAWSLFKLIDTEGTNELKIDDFVEGCLRMRGNAKSLEVNEMMYQNKWMMDRMAEFMEGIEEVTELMVALPLANSGNPNVLEKWLDKQGTRTPSSSSSKLWEYGSGPDVSQWPTTPRSRRASNEYPRRAPMGCGESGGVRKVSSGSSRFAASDGSPSSARQRSQDGEGLSPSRGFRASLEFARRGNSPSGDIGGTVVGRQSSDSIVLRPHRRQATARKPTFAGAKAALAAAAAAAAKESARAEEGEAEGSDDTDDSDDNHVCFAIDLDDSPRDKDGGSTQATGLATEAPGEHQTYNTESI